MEVEPRIITFFTENERLYKIEFDPIGMNIPDAVDWCYVKSRGVDQVKIEQIPRK